MSKTKYIIQNINNLQIEDRCTVAKILQFRDINLKQSNNGTYIRIEYIDEKTIDYIYYFMKHKL